MKRIAIFCILSLTSVFADVKIGTLATKGWVGGQITSSQNSTDEKIARINNRIDTIPNNYVSFNTNSTSILNTADKIVDEVQRRIGDVNRPYTMIYDPTIGRALTADGRLMNYGNAPKITGRFIVNRVASESNSELPNGFMPTLANLPHDELEEGVDWFSTITPSVPDGNGGYYNSTAAISWATSSSGNSILPVTASVEKVVSSFGTQTSLNVNTLGYSYFTVNVPDLGEGECSVYQSNVDGNKVYLYWDFYDYNYYGHYSGTDVFELQFVDEGGNGIQPVAFGDRGKFATVEEMGVIVTDEVLRQFNDVDFVRSKKMLRTGKKMEYGDGWGYIRYDFSTDNRWWEIKVPNVTANVTANSYPYNTTNYAKPYVSERVFVKSSGTNGIDRCKSSVWNIVFRFTDLDIEIGDVTITNGIGIASLTPRIPAGNFYYKNDKEYGWGLEVSSMSQLPSSSVKIGLTYKYRDYYNKTYTNNASITLTAPLNSYTLVTPDYYRNIGGENHHMFWDEAMKCTWSVAVSNGSFFAEVVSTNNLLSSEH